VKPGRRILLDDGNLELQVHEVSGDTVIARVVHGGVITSHKGVNLPGTDLQIPAFTPKDRADLEFGLSQDIDGIAVSFIEKAADIEVVRQAIKEIAPQKARLPIIAKLERPEAIHNLHEIMHAADGVMVARVTGCGNLTFNRSSDPERSHSNGKPACQSGDHCHSDAGFNDAQSPPDPRRSF